MDAARGQHIIETLQVLTKNEPNAIVEIRLLPKKKFDRIYAGYFDAAHFDKVPELIDPILNSNKHTAYCTINRLHGGLIARYNNRLEGAPEKTTTDGEIMAYRWLFVDLDPVRPSGINATNEELEAARLLAVDVKGYCMSEMGLETPVMAQSGNGYHLLFPVDTPNTKENQVSAKEFLQHLHERFSNDLCKIDLVNHNPARITKLYGTICGKGDGSHDRPRRSSRRINSLEVTK